MWHAEGWCLDAFLTRREVYELRRPTGAPKFWLGTLLEQSACGPGAMENVGESGNAESEAFVCRPYAVISRRGVAGIWSVTMLNGDDTLNPAPTATPISPGLGSPNVPPANDYTANSLIVTGPVNKSEAAPNINLDKLLSEQSGAPTVSDASGERH
jgi:hypothetical protein